MAAHWRVWVVGYLVWLIVFTLAEGTGRQICRMPTRKWIAAGADARDRTMRQSFRQQASECLDRTRWYSWSMTGLLFAGLLTPFALVRAIRLRSPWFGVDRPVRRRDTCIEYGLVLAASVLLMLGTIEGVRWMYDWLA